MQKNWAELERETNEVNTNVRHLIRSSVAPAPVSFNPPVTKMATRFGATFEWEEEDVEKSIWEDNKPKP